MISGWKTSTLLLNNARNVISTLFTMFLTSYTNLIHREVTATIHKGLTKK